MATTNCIAKITAFTLLLLLSGCYTQERNCKDFKNGKFEFVQEINGKETKSVFERKDTMQIETFNGKTDTASVRWVNDCELVLQKLHPKSMQEKKAISMKIITTTKTGYTFEFGYIGQGKKQRGTVRKID